MESRENRKTVSEALRDQVRIALRELVSGLEHANREAGGTIFGELGPENLEHAYTGLVTAVMRMIFLLLAESRGLLPMDHDVYARSRSLTGLYGQLQDDRDRISEWAPERCGAWARVVRLFRIVHEGVTGVDGLVVIPARHGSFFDPDAFPFLEGRHIRGGARQTELDVPRIGDGVVFRVLHHLLVLDGQRIAYERVDAEEIGSLYEGLLGFDLEVAQGPSLCVTPEHVVVNLEELLELAGPDRLKVLRRKAALELRDPAAAEVQRAESVGALQVALSRRMSSWQPGPISTGSLYLQPGQARRRSGSHYTPRSVAAAVVESTLSPILDRLDAGEVTPAEILRIRVCDPAMGGGAFLVEACRQLGDRLVAAWGRTASMPELPPGDDPVHHARRLIAQRCLYGVDKNPVAVDLARLTIWLETFAKHQPLTFVDHALRCGDALVGLSSEQVDDASELRAMLADLCEGPKPIRPFDWEVEFPEIFADLASPSERGFDAIVGNPPWVSYAGRAAQPLDDRLRRYFLAFYRSFGGYRNLQALFVERAAQLLAPGGRLGLVLPSSMAELDGYAPSRAAHDRLADSDPELPGLVEDSFPGVFQPSMVLRSTRRASVREATGDPWPMARPDLDAVAQRILRQLDGEMLPSGLFGERGLQSSGEDVQHLLDRPSPRTAPIRIGSNIQSFRRGPAGLHADMTWFGERLREPAEWARVKLLIRQTARVPIAVRSDGIAFRNSILAGFEDGDHPADFLVAYLNSTPIRWCHYQRRRDARLGMPQVKIGHLRATPAPRHEGAMAAIAELGSTLSKRNSGIEPEEQRRLDELVAAALDLSRDDLDRMCRDARMWS